MIQNDRKNKEIGAALLQLYWLMLFYITSIAYLELVYRLWTFKRIGADYLFPVIFALPAGALLFLLSSLLKDMANRIISVVLTVILILAYGVQLVYYGIFRTPLSLYSLTGAGEAMQFTDTIRAAFVRNSLGLLLLFIPLVILYFLGRRFKFKQIKRQCITAILVFGVAGYALSILCVNLTGDRNISQRTLYYQASSPELSIIKLGVMTTMRLDFERLVFKTEQTEVTEDIPVSVEEPEITTPEPTITPAAVVDPMALYNIMDINFKGLAEKESNPALKDMHKYFASVEPTKKNDYTGMFKGDNLILITAEAFSKYAVDPKLTPTLYKMSQDGFVFKNFYNPVWGVSTSDGEYVACTGLIPKSGIWSFAASGKNWMPFVMGNQFRKLGYPTRAYHDHTYTYYKRNISHPNMGYDYKGVGNGLVVKKTWPESDVEMIDVTAPEYIGQQPFHTYYMSVSGHMEYNFFGNYISSKNKALVSDLPYSEPPKAYLAAQKELDLAMKDLLDRLDAAGISDKTVIAISPDHYPYGLPRECIDELAGHKVEDNFELYSSQFILYKKGMAPIVVDEPCASMDIIPTLSNLFGLEYDSRLLMGRDILSDTLPLVIFSNRSWITDKAMYNALTNTVKYTDTSLTDPNYVKSINRIVNNKFKYSAKILENDYYGKVIPKPDKK